MTKRNPSTNLVVVSTSHSKPLDDLGLFELAENPLNGPFRDAHVPSDVAYTRVTALSDADQNVPVVAQESPAALFLGFHYTKCKSGIDNRQDGFMIANA